MRDGVDVAVDVAVDVVITIDRIIRRSGDRGRLPELKQIRRAFHRRIDLQFVRPASNEVPHGEDPGSRRRPAHPASHPHGLRERRASSPADFGSQGCAAPHRRSRSRHHAARDQRLGSARRDPRRSTDREIAHRHALLAVDSQRPRARDPHRGGRLPRQTLPSGGIAGAGRGIDLEESDHDLGERRPGAPERVSDPRAAAEFRAEQEERSAGDLFRRQDRTDQGRPGHPGERRTRRLASPRRGARDVGAARRHLSIRPRRHPRRLDRRRRQPRHRPSSS